ncbi:heparan sulfate glucosamine 3-O-sulfotransferase 1-like [Saccoglossus kowalevskii]
MVVRIVDEPTIAQMRRNENGGDVNALDWSWLDTSIQAVGRSLHVGGTTKTIREYLEKRMSVSCYIPTTPVFNTGTLMKPSVRQEKQCEQRLPSAVIAGVKKCGSGPLFKFLKIHPEIVGPPGDLKYFDGLHNLSDTKWYIDRMPYSTKKQVVLDKEVTAFQSPHHAPQYIREILTPNVKIIFILCDPVERMLSEYFDVWAQRDEQTQSGQSTKNLATRFQDSVLERTQIKNTEERNNFLDKSNYIQHVIRWLEPFSSTNLHFVDGELFKTDPGSELQKIEQFLGIKLFFETDNFYYDPDRGYSCMKYPHPFCFSTRPQHPPLDEWVEERMCEFYKPFNEGLAIMLNRRFAWMDYC